jgi:hypothetical protein
MNKDEALKLAKIWFERNTYGNEAVEVYEAIEQALAAPVQETVWEMFAAYLIDKCEGEIITEEGLQRSLADMLTDPNYTTPPAAQPAPEKNQP